MTGLIPIEKLAVGILISGRGSNMVELVKASRAPDYPARICCVISNRPQAKGLDKAHALGINALAIDHNDYASRRAFEQDVDRALRAADTKLVVLAGFMRVLSPWFIQRWRGRIINIHPSLLPKYKGLNTHARALAAGDSQHGCTVHFVNEELDGGDIISQAVIDIKLGDTPDSLARRLIGVEHKLYPEALKQVAGQLLT